MRLISQTPDFPMGQAVRDQRFTWLLLIEGGLPYQPRGATERREAARMAQEPGHRLLITWPGQYRSDAFWFDRLDDLEALERAR